jgi:hypothetical protein
MQTPLRAAVAAAAIAGAGLAGFGLTTAFAQTDPGDDAPTTTEAPAPADDATPPEGGCMGHHGPGLDVLADAIGIDEADLRAALEDGQTPAEVAEANGVSRDDLVAALVDDINAHIDQAVEDGHLTEAEADERRADVEDHANDIVDGVRPEGRGPGGPGYDESDEAPADADA